jgi:hypothetical protein
MSSPYLKRGESIILTTDRVSINSLLYEVLLTTRHLILVDIRYDQFLPQKIPLSSILSVKGGKVATGEPVITLIFSDDDSMPGSEPMLLIFTQQPGEQRKRERDEWLKNLMANIVSVRQETITSGSPPVDTGHGIRPSSRRSGAHEKITPYTTTVDTSPAPVELAILPDESESWEVPAEDQESPGKVISEPDTQPEITYAIPEPEEIPPVTGVDSGSAGTLPEPAPEEMAGSRPVPPDEEKIPDTVIDIQITEASAAGEISAEPETTPGTEKPFAIILHDALKSLLSSEEKKEFPEASPPSESLREGIEAAQQEEPESPELPTLSEPEVVEFPDAGSSLEPSGEETEAAQQEEPESPELPTSSGQEIVESPTVVKEDSEVSGMIASDAGEIAQPGQETSGQAIPQIPKSPPPTRGSGSQRQTSIFVTAIILIILAIGIGVVFYSHDYPSPSMEPIPLPTPSLQQTTLLQTPVQQTTPQQTTPQQTTVPQTTVQITEAPTPVVIPMDGIWVRVVYTGSYNGKVGNPGSLQSVQGSGDQIYKIKNAGLVQLQINKNDNSGNPLTVEIYRNGELMTHQVRSAPMGSIELLIDAKTGNPPGVSTVLPNETNQTGSSDGRVMYF